MGQSASSQRDVLGSRHGRRPSPSRLRDSGGRRPPSHHGGLTPLPSDLLGGDSERRSRRRTWMGLRRYPASEERGGASRPGSAIFSGEAIGDGLTALSDDLDTSNAHGDGEGITAWGSQQRYASGVDDEDERRQDTRVVRRRLSNRLGLSRISENASERRNRRFSAFGTGDRDRFAISNSRQRIGSISGPLPFEPPEWHSQAEESATNNDQSAIADAGSADSARPRTRSAARESRFSRVRSSIISPMSHFFHHRSEDGHEAQNGNDAHALADDDDQTHRPLSRPTPGGGGRNTPRPPSSLFTARPRSHHSRHRSEGASRDSSNDRHVRRLPSPFRRGSTHHQRQGEDQAITLSRLLSVAAAATAASLVGDTGQAFSQAQDVGDNGPDGTFEGFLRALRNGSLASALRNGGRETSRSGSEPNAGDAEVSPVNFFRMFRFGAVNADGDGSGEGEASGARGASGGGSASGQGDANENSASEGGNADSVTGRMVPVIIVGIRSVTPRRGNNREDGSTTPPLFDAFSNLPLAMPNDLPRGGSGTLMRRTDRRARFGRSRRSSVSNFVGTGHDGQRHPPVSSEQGTPLAGSSQPPMESSLPTVLSDSPPGPHPPPSTPADHALSAFSSGSTTPNQRPSSASAASATPGGSIPSLLGRDGAANGRTSGGNLGPTAEEEDPAPSTRARRRRMSDSEFARYRDLGAGSSRRNGIIGDSELDSPATAPSNTPHDEPRSWIIYVLGGSYPEDHPILTTPSLFTDSPTYEDMLLISSLVGPAKLPVASREDVAAAAGVFKIQRLVDSGNLVARDADEEILLAPGEQCLVCLCNYTEEEEARRLAKCGHRFHRECIDEWLTTGRNSCPLCRGLGVEEKSAPASASAPAQNERPTPAAPAATATAT